MAGRVSLSVKSPFRQPHAHHSCRRRNGNDSREIQNHHEGYVTWNEFLANQDRLQRNCTHRPETILPQAAREGLALLQGLLVCGKCGRRLTVR